MTPPDKAKVDAICAAAKAASAALGPVKECKTYWDEIWVRGKK